MADDLWLTQVTPTLEYSSIRKRKLVFDSDYISGVDYVLY
jgi:hypothetical protein